MAASDQVPLTGEEALNAIRREALVFAEIGLYRCRLDGTVVAMDETARSILGLGVRFQRDEDVVGKNIRDLVHEVDPEGQFRDALRKDGHLRKFERKIKTLDGVEKWALHDFYIAEDKENGDKMIQVVVRDITERKLIENELRDSERRFRRIVETAEEGIWVVDEEDRSVFVNRRILGMLGFEAAEIIGKPLAGFLTAESGDHGQQMLDRSHRGERLEQDLMFARKDGGCMWSIVSCSPVLDVDGTYGGSLLMVTDITDRKLFEQALADERERLAVTLASIADGMIATDPAGHVRTINRVAQMATGWAQDEAEGRPLTEVFHVVTAEGKGTDEAWTQSILGGKQHSHEFARGNLTSRSGAVIEVDGSAAPILNDADQTVGMVVVFRDVTQSRRDEEQIQRTAKLESLADLASGIAHDFNNILTGVLGNICMAKMALTGESNVHDLLAAAERQCGAAGELTAQLLTFSRGGTPVRRRAAVGDFLRQAATFALRGSNVQCKFDIPPDLWAVEIDSDQIGQVIHNLVVNAAQAMLQGGCINAAAANVVLEESPAQVTRVLKPGRYVRITVTDHGDGIPIELGERIFDPYFSTRPEQSGLGLAVTDSILRRHEGAIAFESVVGEGTTFSIFLPVQRPRAIAQETGTAKARAGDRRRILVMDDEPAIRDIATRALQGLGCAVDCVANGEEAVQNVITQASRGAPYDLALLDLTVVGGMGGEEALKRIRALDPAVKMVATSGYATDPAITDFGSHGFDAALRKPFQINELIETIKEQVGPGPPVGA